MRTFIFSCFIVSVLISVLVNSQLSQSNDCIGLSENYTKSYTLQEYTDSHQLDTWYDGFEFITGIKLRPLYVWTDPSNTFPDRYKYMNCSILTWYNYNYDRGVLMNMLNLTNCTELSACITSLQCIM